MRKGPAIFCPTCRRSVAEDARICRACYTVLPTGQKRQQTGARRKLIIAPAAVLVLVLLVAVAVVSQFGASLLEGGVTPSASDGGQAAINRPAAPSKAKQRPLGSSAAAPQRSSFHASVLHAEGQCRIRQSVRNLGEQPLENVRLNFTLFDAAGRPVAEEIEATAAAAIPAGAVRQLDFQFLCPASTTRIEAQRSAAEEGAGASPEVELVSRPLDIDLRGLDPATSMVAAVEIPPLDICPFPESCELQVRIHGGGAAPFRFRRGAEGADLLISEDAILVGHLRGERTAELDLGDALAGATIPLTSSNLADVDVEQPGWFSRWFGRFFSDGNSD